jgi:hypothetical protein
MRVANERAGAGEVERAVASVSQAKKWEVCWVAVVSDDRREELMK